jgi:flagellar biosynthesis/type III secretory pathway protein FliH
MEYRPYQPQPLDKAEEAPRRPAAGLPGGASDFRQEHVIAPGQAAAFEDGIRLEPDAEPDFASIKFQRENTLLTNAESYAASIREEAQLYVRQLRGEVESLNREAEQRYAEAERLKAEAQAEAERLLADAQGQVQEIRSQAHDEGVETGQAEGIRQRYAEAAPQLERLEAVLKEISQFRRRVAFYTEKDGVRLALLMAKKILQSELKTNKQVVARLLASTLATLQGKGTFRVWLSPDDYQFVTSARPALERYLDEEQALTLRAKPDLSPGNVLIETDREVIDLTFESQFYHLEQQLNQTVAEREAVLLQRRPGGEGAAAPQAPATATTARPAVRPAPKGSAQGARPSARKPAARPARPAAQAARPTAQAARPAAPQGARPAAQAAKPTAPQGARPTAQAARPAAAPKARPGATPEKPPHGR